MLGTFLIGRCARGAGAAALFCAALLVADAAHAARHAKRATSHAATPALDAQAIDNAQFSAPSGKGRARAASAATIVKEEILLDRADFSPGEIDGVAGSNDKKALAAFQQANGLKPTGRLDAETWNRLTATSSEPALMEYEIEPADVKGPFNKSIPQSFEKKAELKTLNYTNPRELLAAKFHVAPALLTRLNPKASFETAGTKIVVPNVARKPSHDKVAEVVVDNPTYHYSPKLKFKGVKTQKPFDIAAGPLNPVGTTWIGLGDDYGIHGTPNPATVGKTQSHGCVHLTNWDAQALAKMVHRGTKVEFIN